MLFKSHILEKIKSGEVTMAFRKWKKPTVKKDGTLLSPLGVIRFSQVEPIASSDVTDLDSKKAGYESKKELIEELDKRDGQLFRISFYLEGPDPRLILRNNDLLTQYAINNITKKLDEFDKLSKHGPWAHKTLTLIKENPELRAMDLANKIGVEKDWLKIQIRKLKGLGLTISLGVGYKLSPRGISYLKQKK